MTAGRKRTKPKPRTEEAAENRKMVAAFKDAWESLNDGARIKIAEVAYSMLPEAMKGYMTSDKDVMDQPVWRHVCYAIIENLGLVKGRPHLWKSFTDLIVDQRYWEEFNASSPSRQIAELNYRYKSRS